MNEDQPALAVEGVSYRFGRTEALKEVSFELAAGEFCVLLGPNGAGKSTLFALATRLYDAPAGDVRVFGHGLSRQPGAALSRIGVVFQQPTLDLDLSVAQNLAYHAALHGLPAALGRERAETALARLDMAERAGEKVRALNGGHRRRVEIARALLHAPRLLLLDEPSVGLDVPTRRAIVAHVHALAREEGLAVLWATHLIDEVGEGDSLIVLHRGEVRARGPVPDVLARAGCDSVEAAFDHFTRAAAA